MWLNILPFTLEYIEIYCLQNFINVLGDFESFYSITAEKECDDYMFSQNFMIHSMGKLSA